MRWRRMSNQVSCNCGNKATGFLSTFVLAFVCSYDRFHDLTWGLIAGLWGWFYVAYFLIRYYAVPFVGRYV